jgi:transposase-like protein
MSRTEEIKKMFDTLSSQQQRKLLDILLLEQELSGQLLEDAKKSIQRKRKIKPCPHCKSLKAHRRGKQKGVQMYFCNDCHKWYSETSGTPLFDIKIKHKWQSYISCMEKGMSIKKIAKEIGISIQTSFNWRHKILSSLAQFEPEKLSHEVECDEMELALSNKGERNLKRKPRKRGTDFKRNTGRSEVNTVQVVTAVQRNGEKILKAVESKRLTVAEIKKVFEKKLEENTVLITDKHPSYKGFAKENPNIKHKALLAKDHVDKKDKTIHLQRVNNVHKQVKDFLKPFNGVSSKYLQNYLNWYAYSKKINNSKTTLKNWFISLLTADQAYSLFELFKDNAVNIRT